ncbi:hypothetical protein LOK49_LG04G00531 [Camellia lanceoleosa]|uniref:Uncharacterized protein n=1 Tax=Camellia lanceoleosa TaxID=1840588 RepID=A0ACC0I4Q6_9ERIC|nr:hypothetical protein LOK49_LG04G00531 [Camellia lanceoleosa]
MKDFPRCCGDRGSIGFGFFDGKWVVDRLRWVGAEVGEEREIGAVREEVKVELGGEVSNVDPTVGAVWVEIGLLRIEKNEEEEEEEEEEDKGESDNDGFGGGHYGDLSIGNV